MNPIPASTCWQWRAAARAPRPARALAMAADSDVRSSQAASNEASAASMATRVSASRCRTAWKVPMGRPNWIRSEGVGPGPVRAWPGPPPPVHGRGPAGPGPRPLPTVGGHVPPRAEGNAAAGDLDQARSRIEAADRPQGEVGGRHLQGPGLPGRPGDDDRRGTLDQRHRSEAPDGEARRADLTRGPCHCPAAGRTTPAVGAGSTPRAEPSTAPSAELEAFDRSLDLEEQRTPRCGDRR